MTIVKSALFVVLTLLGAGVLMALGGLATAVAQ